MGSDADFDRAVQLLDECISQCGDEIEDHVTNTDDPTQVIGYLAKHGEWVYEASGNPGTKQFEVRFDFNIPANIANVFSEEEARELVPDPDSVPQEEMGHRAGIAVMEKMDDDLQSEFQYHLISEINDTDTAFNLFYTDGGGISGFTTSRRLYPMDESFSQTEFSHSRQAVINAGLRGIQFVANSFDFEAMVDELAATESESPPRYIQ